jgi:hypothetical protein
MKTRTYKVMNPHLNRNAQLCPYTIRAADKHRVLISNCLEVEDTAKAANFCICTKASRLAYKRLDSFD